MNEMPLDDDNELELEADDLQVSLSATAPLDCNGQRLDQVAAALFDEFSRRQLQQWIKQGQLQLDGGKGKASQRLVGGETLTIEAELEKHDESLPEDIPLNILYQDEHLIVVNKPTGMVVHPGAGNWRGTLVNGLLHFDKRLEIMPRAGIIHRLDKDTSGALIIGRTPEVRQQLVDMMQERLIQRRYMALVWGRPPQEFSVDEPIGRHSRERTRMAVVHSGKPACTHLFRQQRWGHAAQLIAELETGRTHQIRVHCLHEGYPLVGDPVYGKKRQPNNTLDPRLQLALSHFQRQALHAFQLNFEHPVTGEELALECPPPQDLLDLISAFDAFDSI